MELELREINVMLSNDQMEKIRNAFINSAKIRLRLKQDCLKGPYTLLIPTKNFQDMDNEDGIDAVVNEQTEKEMKNKMRKELKLFRDDEISYKMFKNMNDISISGCFDRFFECRENGKLSDETLEEIINEKIWRYYGLFFEPAIDESLENEGIEFVLDYSLLNDLAKDFVKYNIKNLFY